MPLLQDIQKAAIDAKSDLPTLLRMCKLLAVRLGNEEFEHWVDSELNGYSDRKTLPEYRILSVQSYGNFDGTFRSANEMQISLTILPEQLREVYGHAYFLQGISALVTMVNDPDGRDLIEEWPVGVAVKYASKQMVDMQCIAAWKRVPRAAVVSVVDAVRNRILGFALEIEKRAPEAGESPLNLYPLPQETVTQIFHTNITGNVQNVAAGSMNVRQQATITVEQDNFEQLEAALLNVGLVPDDVKSLKRAIQKDREEQVTEKLGGEKGKWLQKVLSKAASGGLKATVDVASSAIVKALSQYFGWS